MKTPKANSARVDRSSVNAAVSVEEQIAQRAREIWQEGGRRPDDDLANWFKAEREITEHYQRRLAQRER